MAPRPLDPGDFSPDPVPQFVEWFGDARAAGEPEPEAVALATARADGHPSVRFVLMRGVDERGWEFYTNYESRKGGELAENPWGALAFRWPLTERQVRVSGPVARVTPEESDAYFAGRPRQSQLGAWASDQSRPVSGADVLVRRHAEMATRFEGGPVPRPPFWGGYRIEPVEVEFWQQGQFRLHSRLRYCRRPDGGWSLERLYP